MKSNPVAEFAYEHYGLEFATHTAFLSCSARPYLDQNLCKLYGIFFLRAAIPLCYLIFNKTVYSVLTQQQQHILYLSK